MKLDFCDSSLKRLSVLLVLMINNVPNYLVIALERLEVVQPVNWSRVSNPLQSLPVCDDPNVVHLIDEVQEHDKTFFVMGLSKPGRVVEETEWCSEIILEYIVDFLYIMLLTCMSVLRFTIVQIFLIGTS